ncbi:MAG: hypothetical protein AB7N65_27105 [Vicinamibacterales bacterium]
MKPGVAKPVVQMTAGCVGTWLLASLVLEPAGSREVLLGMLAPLGVAAASWVVVALAYRVDRTRVTGVLMAAFGVKMVIFGAYVTLMLRGMDVRPVPFVVSFTAYFIGLHLAEAWWLRRLFAEDAAGVR